MTKIDILPIVTRHLETLRNNATGKRSPLDLALFVGLPLILAGLARYYRVAFTVDALTAVLASFSIFAGLLLNLLVLVYTFAGEDVRPDMLAANKKKVVQELHDNIQFAVLISVFVVMLSLAAFVTLKKDNLEATARTGATLTACLVFLTGNFLLTLLMILKRIHRMLLEKMDRSSSSSIRKAS